MGAYIYDPMYCKVMTICVCDMMCEMADAQEQMWISMLALLRCHGIENVNFKGFMADSAQTNFNAIRKIFGFGDKSIPMEGKERTCQFHWAMALDWHTEQLIKPELQAKHIELCHEYQRCTCKVDADLALAALKTWWFLSEACLESSLKELMFWIDFWHFYYEQWGSHISEVWLRVLGFSFIVLNLFFQSALFCVVGFYFVLICFTEFVHFWPHS